MPAERAEALPTLSPVLVAGEGDVDELVRTARAGVAILSLRLRTAQQEADLAAREHPVWDLAAARELVNASVGQRMQTRRVEMADELERARSEAARRVLSARAEAADLIASASEETLAVLLAGAARVEPSVAPNLRVVSEPELYVPPAPYVPPARVAEPHPVAMPAPLAEPEPESPADPLPAAVAGQVRVAVAAAVREVVAEVVPAPVAEPVSPGVPAPEPASQPTIVTPPSAPAAAATSEDRSGVARFLYLDVLLPMVAVLVLLIVLLAWIG